MVSLAMYISASTMWIVLSSIKMIKPKRFKSMIASCARSRETWKTIASVSTVYGSASVNLRLPKVFADRLIISRNKHKTAAPCSWAIKRITSGLSQKSTGIFVQ